MPRKLHTDNNADRRRSGILKAAGVVFLARGYAAATTLEIASKATELSLKQYELQKARFDAGLSTSRLVLQAQDDLEAARVNELAAKVTLRTSVAELNRLQGTSIQRFRVQLSE